MKDCQCGVSPVNYSDSVGKKNQRTNGPVNAPLIPGPFKNRNIQIIMKSLDPLRAKKTFIRKKLGHTAVSAIKASSKPEKNH